MLMESDVGNSKRYPGSAIVVVHASGGDRTEKKGMRSEILRESNIIQVKPMNPSNAAFKSVLAVSCLAVVAMTTPAHALTPPTTFISQSDLTTTLGSPYPIGFTYAGDRFVGSGAYPFGTQLYQTNLNGGGITTFGAPLTGFSGEIFVASSFATGAYGSNLIYAGSQNTTSIVQLAHDGSSQSVFATGIVGGVRSIAFDPYGNYGNDMIVATMSGNIYKVDSSGIPTLLANVGEDTEGIGFAPQTFGSYAKGTLFVASENSGNVRAIDPAGVSILHPDGVFSTAFTVSSAETVSFVPLNIGASGNPVEGFYGVNYPLDIVKWDASQFTPYAGDAIVTSELGHGIYDVTAGISGFSVNNIGSFPDQPEDSIFVTADVVQGHGGSVPDGGNTLLLLLGPVGLLGVLARCRRRTAA